MDEIWKEYKYSDYCTLNVSNLGNVKIGNKILNQSINEDGYLVVSLKYKKREKDGRIEYRSVGVHRIVACSFLGKFSGMEVNHKDYNRKNNNLKNLEWMTHADNVRYSVCNKSDISGKNNPNYGNKKLSKIYKENPDYALEKQSRKGLKNGRCRKICMYNENFTMKFDYIKECLEYLVNNKISNCKNAETLRSQISKAIKEDSCYKGYKFRLIDND